MLPRSFYFVRHGETDWNLAGRLQGFTDIPLNETGRRQARAAQSLLAGLDIGHIVASPLGRAWETAQILNEKLGATIESDEGLRERHFGVMEGQSVTLLDQLRRAAAADIEECGYACPEGAETYADFKLRTFARIGHHLQAQEGRNVLFVCHGGLYRVLRRSLIADVGHSGNVEPYWFEKHSEGWRIHLLQNA
jgi:broad specificity phosphatase PhoE